MSEGGTVRVEMQVMKTVAGEDVARRCSVCNALNKKDGLEMLMLGYRVEDSRKSF